MTSLAPALSWRRPHGNVAILTAVAIFALLCGALATLANPRFLGVGNIISIAQSTSAIGIGALGMCYLIGAGFFDLSVSGIVPLAAVAMAFVHAAHTGAAGDIASIVAALIVGLIAGAVNGVLVVRARIPAFVTTLGTLFLFTSIVELLTNGGSVTIDGAIPVALASDTILSVIPLCIVLLLALAIVLNFGLWRTRIGRYVRFIGVSQKAAQVWGAPVGQTIFLGFCLSGLTAAVASIVLGGMFSSANAAMAPDFNLNTIAAVVIGGTRLEGGRASIIGTVIGAFLLAEITNVLTLLGVNPYFQYVAVGVLLIAVVGLGNEHLVEHIGHSFGIGARGKAPAAIARAENAGAHADPEPLSGPAIELARVSHSYGPVEVLHGVDFAAVAGECLGLLGQNGAGKSTIINILTGKVHPSEGTVRLGGRAVVLAGPKAARQAGIAVVAQELELAPTLSVADNIVLGVEPRRFGPFLDHGVKRQIAARAIARLGVELDPDAIVEELPLGEQQLTEICRSLAQSARVIIFDEPTSSLNFDESKRLLRVIGELKRAGCAVVFVSHKLGEVLEICDRLCVLRDGAVVGKGTAEELGGPVGVTALLLNRAEGSIGGRAAPRETAARAGGEVAISVRHLVAGGAKIAALDCHYGEIVGLSGVEGSGSTETIEALAGLYACEAEAFRVGSVARPFASPCAAVRAGVVGLPPDRKNEGIFAELSIAENMALGADLPRRSLFAEVRWQRDTALFSALRARIGIKAAGPLQACRALSGGNQQKVLFGRAEAAGARIWLLSEPTRGIDIGARGELYALIRARAEAGWCVVVKSIDPAELASVCDRCYVFAAGRIVHELLPGEITEEAIYSAGDVARAAEIAA